MSKYHDAANVLKREANRFQELSETAKTLDEIGGLSQAADAEMSRAALFRKDVDQSQNSLKKLKADIEKQQAIHDAKIKEADDIYAKTIHDANMSASDKLAKAESQAVKIVADAQANAEANVSALVVQVKTLEATKENLTKEVAALQQVAIIANTEAESAEKRLSRIKESIAKLATV